MIFLFILAIYSIFSNFTWKSFETQYLNSKRKPWKEGWMKGKWYLDLLGSGFTLQNLLVEEKQGSEDREFF